MSDSTTSSKPIVFGYVRVSGKSQVDGDGPERQEEAIRRFCGQHGLAIPNDGVAYEWAVSGTVEGTDRPVLSALLATVESISKINPGLVLGIVVERLDRLARDLMVSEALLGELRRRNLKLFAADQGALIDLATNDGDPMRKAIRQIMGVMAELDKSMLVKKLRAARDRKRETEGRCEGTKPFGSTKEEAPILAYILRCRESGYSYASIAKALNQEHSAGLTKLGGWTRSKVQGILRHRKETE